MPAARAAGFVARGTSAIRQVQYQTVGYEDDIAGPALRIARLDDERSIVRRDRRLAQQEGDALEEAFGQPFGTEANDPAVTEALEEALERPFGVQEAEPMPETNTSEGLFDDLPADPFDEEDSAPPADEQPDVMFDDDPLLDEPMDTEPMDGLQQTPRGDFEPAPRFDRNSTDFAEPADDEIAEELQAPFGGSGYDDNRAKERVRAARDCAENLAEVKADRLAGIDLSIAVTGVEGEDFPYNCSIDDGTPFQPRSWAEVTYMWKASALCHKPLFFEDTQLERYGHSWGPYVQPLISGAHFFSRIAVLPYNAGLTPPNECIYTLGHYRPGDCAPYLIEPVPFTWRAAALQGAASVGVAGILP